MDETNRMTVWGLRATGLPGYYLSPTSKGFVRGSAPRIFANPGDAHRAKTQIANSNPDFAPLELVMFELRETGA